MKKRRDVSSVGDKREKLITEICNHILHERSKSEKAEGDVHTVVREDIDTGHGNVYCAYHIKTAIADFFKVFEARVDDIALKTPGGERNRFDLATDSMRESTLSFLVQHAAVLMIAGLDSEIKSAISRLFEKAIVYAEVKTMALAINNSENSDATTVPIIDPRENIALLKKKLEAEKEDVLTRALSSIHQANVVTGKGRPRIWTKESLHEAVRTAATQFKKGKYRNPNLKDVASVLNKKHPDRMQLNAKSLGQMLKRHEIEWMGIKNPQN
jgi:hypothetical protein